MSFKLSDTRFLPADDEMVVVEINNKPYTIYAGVVEAPKALSTSTSSGSEADTKPSSTLEENIEALLYEDVGFWDMNSEIEAAHLKQTVQRLLSLYQKELVRELQPFTDLTDFANGTHSTPCQLCGEPSHRCNCDLALYYVERMAKNRLRGITEPIVIGVDEDTKPDLTGEQP